jgi:hypothetical protein
MIEKILEEDLQFMEDFYYPPAFTECIFSDLTNLTLSDEEKFSNVRLYQYPMLAYDYLIDDEPNLTEKENFEYRENVADIHCYGARLFGKTLIVEQVDLLMNMVLDDGNDVGFTSYDAAHIEGVLEEISRVLNIHPFYKLFKARVKRNPFIISLDTGWKLNAVNMNLQGNDSGAQFYQKHFKRLYCEEASFETDEVYKKRLGSVSELGCVYRFAGMCNFTKHKPAGKIYYDLKKKPWILNLPSYVNPMWNDKTKEEKIQEHGGEQSLTYRIFVKGEVVEDGISALDMERVRKNYSDNKIIKHFEITKENFFNFESILIVERPSNAENIFICADIGETAPTEIAIFSQVNGNFRYLYNITLYSLTDKEQFKLFKWLAEKIKTNFIGLDTTDGMGRAIYRSLEEVFPKENLCWVSFNEKIKIDFERDTENNIVFENGLPLYKEELVDSWSVKRLRDILYEEGKIEIPIDYKLDSQLNSVIATQSGNKTLYACASTEDHLFAAFRVFAITEWTNTFVNVKPIIKKTFAKSGC